MINVYKYNTQILEDLTLDEFRCIAGDLTLDNPDYYKAKKFSKYSRITLPKHIFYYKRLPNNSLEVPSGYNIPFKHEILEDKRLEVTVNYPEINIELRKAQENARKSYLDNPEHGLIVMPTGMGKSILGIYLAYNLRQKCLVIVHKNDLVDGWKKDIEMCFEGKVKSGLIKAKSRKIGKQITIATIQTLNRLSNEELSNLVKEFGMIIIDEFHRSPASSYDMINNFQAYYKVGLTATPERNDGLGKVMSFYVGDINYKYESKDGTNEDILPVKVKTRNCNVYYRPKLVVDKGKLRFKNKNDKNLEEFYIDQVPYESRPRINFHRIENTAITNLETIKQVCIDIALEYNLGRNLIVFFNQKDHCETYYNTLIEDFKIPKNKIQLYYGDSTESVEVMKEKAEKGEVKITLATYSIATEGTNVKSWEIAFLVGSINNGKNVEQAVGRIRRTKKGKINPVLVYDYRFPNVYILKNHGRTRDLRYEKLKFEFEGKKKQRKLNIGYQ